MTSRLRVALFAVLLGGLGLVSALVARREAPTLTLTPRHEGAGCARCHQATGVEDSHAALGCEACHLGDVDGGTADEAHAGLVRIPGNFPDMARTCGAAACHPSVPLRLRNNLMATMAGVVNVDRWAFGEQAEPSCLDGVDTLGHSAADTHLRNLCASCHLGREKRDFGPVGERSRPSSVVTSCTRIRARSAATSGRLMRARMVSTSKRCGSRLATRTRSSGPTHVVPCSKESRSVRTTSFTIASLDS
jgi:hypothetical protein